MASELTTLREAAKQRGYSVWYDKACGHYRYNRCNIEVGSLVETIQDEVDALKALLGC